METESTDIIRTYPEWSSPLLSVDCVYIQTFEELGRSRIKLSEKETEAQFFNTEMKTKWMKLRKQQLDFLGDIQKYDNFFRENEQKFRRVSVKINAELAAQRHLESDIDTCEKRNEYLSQMLLKMGNSVDTLTPYHTFVSALVMDNRARDYGLKDVDSFINLIVSFSQNTLHDEFSNILFQYENLRSQIQERKMVQQSELSKEANDLFITKKLLKNGQENLLLLQCTLKRMIHKDENEKSKLVTHHNIYQLLREWKERFHPRKPGNNNQDLCYFFNLLESTYNTVAQVDL